MSDAEFEQHVNDALDAIPERLLDLLDNSIIVIEDDSPADEPDLFGFYDGTPLTERDSHSGVVLPDRIVIFRDPILRWCTSHEEVVHEIAHFFGIDDDRLHELGYA